MSWSTRYGFSLTIRAGYRRLSRTHDDLPIRAHRGSTTRGTDVDVKVGGITASATDYATYTAERLPVFIGLVLLLSFLLLMVVFRSVLVPLKAVIMNLLSIGAAYGVIVAVFQWGWLKDLVGVAKAGPVEAWAPMFLFAHSAVEARSVRFTDRARYLQFDGANASSKLSPRR